MSRAPLRIPCPTELRSAHRRQRCILALNQQENAGRVSWQSPRIRQKKPAPPSAVPGSFSQGWGGLFGKNIWVGFSGFGVCPFSGFSFLLPFPFFLFSLPFWQNFVSGLRPLPVPVFFPSPSASSFPFFSFFFFSPYGDRTHDLGFIRPTL